MDKNITYIVTGCTGYVGNVLCKRLLREECTVIGFAQSEKKAERVYQTQKPQFVFGDITDYEDVKKLFVGENPFVIIHTVAKVTIGEGDLKEAEKITVGGTQNILKACAEFPVKKLLHISSTEVLPETFSGEDFNYTPAPQAMAEGYPKAKSLADELVCNAVRQTGLNASVLALSCVVGAGDYSCGHMSQMIIDFLKGKLPASVKGGYNNVDIQDIAEVLPAIIECSKAGENYIFATEPSEINDILRILCQISGKKMPVTLPLWVAYMGIPFLWAYSKITRTRPLYTATALNALKRNADFPIQKSVKEFTFSPRPLAQSIQEHVDFLREIGEL